MTIHNNFNSIALVAAIVVGITGLASPTVADETIELNQYDLTRVEDADRLQLDIVRAASHGCKALYRGWIHDGYWRRVKSCIKRAVDSSIENAQIIGLSQRHASIGAEDRYDTQRGPVGTQSASAQ